MEVILIVSVIILVILCIFLATAWFIGKGKQTKTEDDNAHLKHLLDLYAEDEEDYKEEIAILKKDLNDAFESEKRWREKFDGRGDKINELKEKLAAAEKSKAVGQVQEDRLAQLETQVAAYNKQIEDLQQTVIHRQEELKGFDKDREVAIHKLNRLNKEYVDVQEMVNTMMFIKSDLQVELDELNESVADMKIVHSLAVDRLNEHKVKGGWEPFLSPHEQRLVDLIDEMVSMYPDLASDLNTIKWKKIWLPKVQGIVGQEKLDGKMGIYRLALKEDEGVCYVGQAVNIKERWYQHIRKMLGVDSRGNEKLYKYSDPGLFVWEIVEEVKDRGKLDERERYWIEFYGCKEWGLNKK